jgi:uncharacterized protein (TIGR02391 family)
METRLIAIKVGDRLKNDAYMNEIHRVGQSVLNVNLINYQNRAITSSRAQAIYDWIMSLEKAPLSVNERMKRLVKFCMELSPDSLKGDISSILVDNGCDYNLVYKDNLNEFYSRNYHPEIVRHSQKLFLQQNYFHAVFESIKAFNNCVKEKSYSNKDGQELMMNVFAQNGVLKLNTGQTESEQNVQEGVKFLASGLMRTVRNPTAHEPALDWPISKQECLDFLSMISFLFIQLDKAIYLRHS